MVRLPKMLFVHSLGVWLWFAGVEQSSAQQSADVTNDMIRIADFGLENQLPSAFDLVGPEDGPAGRNRAALAHHLRCWIDGTESCYVPDLNDPRVRAIRRFLGQSKADQNHAVVIRFPDQTRIDVLLARVSDSDPADWTQSAYRLEVRPSTVRAAALPAVPSRRAHSDALTH